jgi:cyclin-dependent kinase 2
MEWMEKDLAKFIDNKTEHISIFKIQSIMLQLLRAVQYMHDKKCMHRDLKPGNILIQTSTNKVKIADFGLAKGYYLPGRPLSNEVQTLNYRAPELIMGSTHYGAGVDVWSLGCIFVELVTGNQMFLQKSEIGLLFEIFNIFGTPKVSNWPELAELPEWKHTMP